MANDLYPFIIEEENSKDDSLEMFKEIAWDYLRDKPLVDEKTKEYVIVEGDEALKVWIYKVIKIARYRYPIFSTDYGTELEELVGDKYTKGYTESEAIRYIREALSVNEYIKNINIIDSNFSEDNLKLRINVDTVYSEGVELSV